MHILLNALNSASAGGLGVLHGLVPALARVAGDDELTAVVPAGTARLMLDLPGRVRLLERARSGPRWVWRLLDDLIRFPALARRLGPDVFFSTTDLGPGDVGCPHVMLLHNPWVTYRLPRRRIGASLRDQLVYATYYPIRFGRLWPKLARIIVQTPVMSRRLHARFGVPEDRIAVIPPGCLLTPRDGGPPRRRVTSTAPLRLFWPARGYRHKNHDVLLPLCRELERRGLAGSVRIFVTLDPRGDRRTRSLVRRAATHAPLVTNLGRLAKPEVEGWFDGTDALFLPTLLESYSLTYLEAAARRRPILTSDRDFARWACGTAGYYFDPDDPGDICDRIRELMGDMEGGAARIPGLPEAEGASTSWDDVARRVIDVLHDAADGATRRGEVDRVGR